MRAALPHLRLLTLKSDQLSKVKKFLSSEEKTFLAQQMVFQEDVGSFHPLPPLLNTNTTPRSKPISHDPYFEELIPESLIITDPLKMIGKTLHSLAIEKLDINVAEQDRVLKGVELLTRANSYSGIRQTSGDNKNRSIIYIKI